jgi:hypothetical protein
MHTMLILATLLGGHVGEGEMMQAVVKLHRLCVIIEWMAVFVLPGPKVIITLLIFLIILLKVLF